jgi:hypothetical protein
MQVPDLEAVQLNYRFANFGHRDGADWPTKFGEDIDLHEIGFEIRRQSARLCRRARLQSPHT